MLMINYYLFMLRYSSGNYWAAEIYRVIILTFYLLPRLSLAEMRHLPSNDVNPPPLSLSLSLLLSISKFD